MEVLFKFFRNTQQIDIIIIYINYTNINLY